MRISTNMMFQTGANRLSTLQSEVLRTQEKIAANTRILTPSDDPNGAARVLEVKQSQSLNTQYAENRNFATSSLTLEESVLGSVTKLIQDVQTQIVEAGDGAYDGDQRRYLANDLRGRLEELVGLANTRDDDGNYLFSGYKTATQAFSQTSTGVLYNGDQGSRSFQVGSVRDIPISDSGDAVFMRVASNVLYESGAAISNTSDATVSSITVTDVTQLTRHDYNLVYDHTANQFTVTDLTTGTSLPAIDYTGDPQTLSFDGMQVTVSGTVNDGDAFMVRQALTDADEPVLIQNSNGLFVTAPGGNNLGSATVSPYRVTDTSALTGDEYLITYDADLAGAPPAPNFVVTDVTTGLPVTGSPFAYDGSESSTLTFDGQTLTIHAADTMVDGDSFTIKPATETQDGYFVTAATVGNTGTGSASGLTVADPALVTGHEYQVTYDGAGGQFVVTDLTLGSAVNIAYTGDPQTLAFDGLTLTVSGSLDDGDAFTIRQALEPGETPAIIEEGAESVFDMLDDLIGLLETATTGTPAGQQALTNGLALASANFNNALDHILTVRASVGSRLSEMESLDSAGENRDLQYAQTLSNLQDLDYVKAISDLTMQTTTLQAAQQSYVQLMRLSLFEYL
jgi:flagellar hook-associated protein 3 FlgL